MEEASVDNPIHVETQGGREGAVVDNPNTYPQGEHRHLWGWPVVIAVEGGGGDHCHLPEVKRTPPRRPTWFPRRERNGIEKLELDMVQDLASVDQDPLFLVFLDL